MNLISHQVHFCEGVAGISTAIAIIRQKIKNQRGLLLSRMQNAKRASRFSLQKLITVSARQLDIIERDLLLLNGDATDVKKKIFLHEARAAQVYWKTFALLISNPTWRREPRKRSDSANGFLDIGYHLLFQKIKTIVEEVGLHPEIGVLHSGETSLPLIFDLAELWRQPIVDLSVLNIIRRHRIKAHDTENYVGLFCAEMKRRMESKTIRYEKQCVRQEWVMRKEMLSFRACIERSLLWQPIPYLWSRSQYCR